jgi:flagellar hook-basal body complex protein FliE
MDINSATAAGKYLSSRPATAPKVENATPGNPGAGLVRDFAETLQAGEQTAQAAITGGADPHALVQALAQTELAVETAVTVRDKVVQAYQEILRMPV